VSVTARTNTAAERACRPTGAATTAFCIGKATPTSNDGPIRLSAKFPDQIYPAPGAVRDRESKVVQQVV